MMGLTGSTRQTRYRARTPESDDNKLRVSAASAGLLQRVLADQRQARQQRDLLIASHMAMAARIARSFAGRGEELDDLTQVAMLELVKAGSRFDPVRGVTFARYAHPCIVGGLKKHFRDRGWSLHITRRMQELHLQVNRAVPGLTQLLGHIPTIPELAVHLRLSEQDARDGVNSGLAYTTRSLDTPARDGDETTLDQIIGSLDPRMESVADRHVLGQQVAVLPSREQDVLRLRFVAGMSQREIAESLGISQMHVSRLLARSMVSLRTGLLVTR